MLGVILWPVSVTVQLAYSVLSLLANLTLWIVSSLLPQLFGVAVSVFYSLFTFVRGAVPVAFNLMYATGIWLSSGIISACQLVFSCTLSAAEGAGSVMAVLFANLWTGCQLLWAFLCTFLSSLGQWTGEAVQLSAQAGYTVMEYINSLPWANWAGSSLSFVSGSLKVVLDWMDDLGRVLKSSDTSPHKEFTDSTFTNLDSDTKMPEAGHERPYTVPVSSTHDNFRSVLVEQVSAVLPTLQQLVGLVAVVVLLIAAEYSARKLLEYIRETQRRQTQVEAHQEAEQYTLRYIRENDRRRHQTQVEAHQEAEQHAHRQTLREAHQVRQQNPPLVALQPSRVSSSRRNYREVASPQRREREPPSPSLGARQQGETDGTSLHRRVSELAADLERERDQNLCVVCLDQRRDVLLRPCNHYCVCSGCLEGLHGCCPICRKRVTASERLFHA